MRIVQNRKAAEKHYRRIKEYAPKTGVVRMLRLTEKQYDNITMITGEPDYQEQTVEAHCGDYIVKPAEDNPYDSELWESLVNNSYDRPADRSIKHNDLIMKSDFEVEVAKLLESMGIEYKYEGKLILGAQGRVFPDFSLHFPEYNRCAFLEVLGGLDNFAYSKSNAEKINKYINAGLYPNRDVTFIPGDYYYRPDTDSMRRIISTIAESFVQQYVYSGRI